MTPYEDVIYFYSSLHDRYQWTQQQIDDTDLGYLLDGIVLQAKIKDAENDVPFENQF